MRALCQALRPLPVACILATLLNIGAATLHGDALAAHAASDSSQVQFNAGDNRYLTYLKICGVNQNDDPVCWSDSIGQEQYATLYGWWWKLDRGIKFEFALVGYGNRTCYIRASNYGNPDMLYVTYQGNNQCTFR